MAAHRPRPDRSARRAPAPGPVVLACLLLAGAAALLAAVPPPTAADAPLELLRGTPQAREIEPPHDPVRPPETAPTGSDAGDWWRYRERPVAQTPRPPIERPRPRPPGGGDHPAYRALPPADTR